MNREVHVRFWESPEVKVLRATRQTRRFQVHRSLPVLPYEQMRWMAPAHGIWVPKCEGHQAFTSKMGAIRYADYHDRPRLGQERFSGPRR